MFRKLLWIRSDMAPLDHCAACIPRSQAHVCALLICACATPSVDSCGRRGDVNNLMAAAAHTIADLALIEKHGQ